MAPAATSTVRMARRSICMVCVGASRCPDKTGEFADIERACASRKAGARISSIKTLLDQSPIGSMRCERYGYAETRNEGTINNLIQFVDWLESFFNF